MDSEERMAVFLDYENLALGARDHLGGMDFDYGPISDALAVRGRTVMRRAYADWSFFDEDRRALTRHQVELIEMPQRMGVNRKNAADIKMVVDAIEVAFERDHITTFVMCTGDSDFSPLVHKLREMNKRVIGIGVENSTSRLLPPACDEFLFYDRLEGVEAGEEPAPSRRGRGRGKRTPSPAQEAASTADAPAAGAPAMDPATTADAGDVGSDDDKDADKQAPMSTPGQSDEADDAALEGAEQRPNLDVRVAQTLAGLAAAADSVTASVLKRALLRKDPTFSESDHGFRSFGEVLRHLADRNVVELSAGPAAGDPQVTLPERGEREDTFALLVEIVRDAGGQVPLSGLKDRVRKHRPEFSEKSLGYRSFLQFCKAAQTDGHVSLHWDEQADGYLVAV